VPSSLVGIVAAEISRLAHFAEGVGQGLARLAARQGHQRRAVAFEEIGQALQHRRPVLGPARVP
jgi:sulfite reductase beta subunit-like hemoprotein